MIPPYALHRDPRYFSPKPDDFWPERWLSSSSTKSTSTLVLNHSAFIPFSYGPQNCVGKRLAMVEMRMVVSLLVQRFDISFAEGFDRDKWEDNMQDWFVVEVGRLPVKLALRR